MGIYKIGKIYYVDFYANGCRIRHCVGDNRKITEAVYKKETVEVVEGKYLDIKKNEKIKFRDFAQEYLAVHAKNKKSMHSDLDAIKVLNKYLGGKYLYEITQYDVEKIKAERAKEVSGATVNRHLAILKCMFNKAIAWKKLNSANPVKGIKFFKEQPRQRFLEKEEIQKLIQHCSEHLRPIIIVALHTGMRKGEILNLKWHDVDFKRGIAYLYNTKNGERREIPINDVTKKTLIAITKHPDSPFIFCNKDGKPYGDIKKSFFTACKNAGIIKSSNNLESADSENSSFRFHDLRHTFASQLVMNGVDLNTVRELLGHKDLKMTLRYSHLSKDHKTRAVDILGSVLEQKSIDDSQKVVKNTEVAVFEGKAIFDNSLALQEIH